MRQDGDSVITYYAKFRKVWMELAAYDPVPECSCQKRAKAREKEKGYAFLMGLNKSLSNVRTQLLLKNPSPSLDQAYSLVEEAVSTMNSTRC